MDEAIILHIFYQAQNRNETIFSTRITFNKSYEII